MPSDLLPTVTIYGDEYPSILCNHLLYYVPIDSCHMDPSLEAVILRISSPSGALFSPGHHVWQHVAGEVELREAPCDLGGQE